MLDTDVCVAAKAVARFSRAVSRLIICAVSGGLDTDVCLVIWTLVSAGFSSDSVGGVTDGAGLLGLV